MQAHVQNGDTLPWNSGELVSIPFCKPQELALRVATAAVLEDRKNTAAVWHKFPDELPPKLETDVFISPKVWALLSDGRVFIGRFLHKPEAVSCESQLLDWILTDPIDGASRSIGTVGGNIHVVAWSEFVVPAAPDVLIYNLKQGD